LWGLRKATKLYDQQERRAEKRQGVGGLALTEDHHPTFCPT